MTDERKRSSPAWRHVAFVFCLVVSRLCHVPLRFMYKILITIRCKFSTKTFCLTRKWSRYCLFAIWNTFRSRPDPPGCWDTCHSRAPSSRRVSQMWRLHFGSLHLRTVGARRLSALHRTLMELQIKQLSLKRKKKKKEKREIFQGGFSLHRSFNPVTQSFCFSLQPKRSLC